MQVDLQLYLLHLGTLGWSCLCAAPAVACQLRVTWHLVPESWAEQRGSPGGPRLPTGPHLADRWLQLWLPAAPGVPMEPCLPGLALQHPPGALSLQIVACLPGQRQPDLPPPQRLQSLACLPDLKPQLRPAAARLQQAQRQQQLGHQLPALLRLQRLQ